MKLAGFIIGLMAFIAVTIVTLSFVTDLYAPDALNVTLSNDSYTSQLATLQAEAIDAQGSVIDNNAQMMNQTAGQPGATLDSGSISEGDLMKSSLKALTNTPKYVSTFGMMIQTAFKAAGISTDHPIFWFITSYVLIIIALILVGVVFRNNIFT